jgi:hypothetical protein
MVSSVESKPTKNTSHLHKLVNIGKRFLTVQIEPMMELVYESYGVSFFSTSTARVRVYG